MSLSCPAATALTDTDMRATFTPPAGGASLLPTEEAGRTSDGLLTKEFLGTYIQTLLQRGVIPVLAKNTDTAEARNRYAAQLGQFGASAQAEYCFYDARYKYALNSLITKLAGTYNGGGGAGGAGGSGAAGAAGAADIQMYLDNTKALNQKLNDLTQIMNAITTFLLQRAAGASTAITALNDAMKTRSAELTQQRGTLSASQDQASLYREMMSYTKQKVRTADNLLNLYTFLNVFALGMLGYLFMSYRTG